MKLPPTAAPASGYSTKRVKAITDSNGSRDLLRGFGPPCGAS